MDMKEHVRVTWVKRSRFTSKTNHQLEFYGKVHFGCWVNHLQGQHRFGTDHTPPPPLYLILLPVSISW